MTESIFTPPHSLDAEKSVIGSCLLDKEAIIKVSDLIKPQDFYDANHGAIYEAITGLFQNHKPVDVITVADKLKDNNLLDRIGGPSYLVELSVSCPSSTNAFEYGLLVKNKAVLRNLMKAGQEISSHAMKTQEELTEVLERSERSLFMVTQTFINNHFIHIKDILGSRYEEFCNLHDSKDKNKIKGISYGFSNIDFYTQGLKPSELIIVAARPSMGKSAFALNMVAHAALKEHKVVGFFSLEMPKEQLVDRMFSTLLEVDSSKLQKGLLDDNDFARMGEVMDDLSLAEIYFDDAGGLTIAELKSKARRLQMEHGLDMIVIDYLQLMSGKDPNNRVQEISEISRGLKALAKELRIPVVALAQLSRASEQRPNKQPILSDLRDSGSIEQDADVVLMMYRESYYDPECEFPNRTDIFIKKNRNGPVGAVDLIFEIEKGKFVVPEKKFDFSEDISHSFAA